MSIPDPDPEHARRPTRIRWLVFALACAASWLLYLHRYSWGVVKPYLRKEFPTLTDGDLGWLDGVFNATYALGQVPGGLAGDLLGPRGVLAALTLLWSLAAAGLVWAPGFWSIFGVRAAFGAAQAGVYPVISKVTRGWFPLAVRTLAQGAVTALGRVGAACAPLLIATVLMGWLDLGWRDALLLLGAPGVVLAGLTWYVLRNSPREHPWVNAAERKVIEAGDTPPAVGAAVAWRLDPSARFSFAMLLVYAFLSTFADMLYVFWIPTFLVEGKGLSAEMMGLFAPLPLLGGAVGGVVGGALNDFLIQVTGNRRVARRAVAFTGKFLAAVLLALSVAVADGRLAMVVLLAVKFFGDWSLPTQWGTMTDISGRATATVFGVVNTVGSVGGTAAGPTLGYLKAYFGWEGLFYGVAGVYVLAAATWLLIDCTRRLVVETESPQVD